MKHFLFNPFLLAALLSLSSPLALAGKSNAECSQMSTGGLFSQTNPPRKAQPPSFQVAQRPAGPGKAVR